MQGGNIAIRSQRGSGGGRWKVFGTGMHGKGCSPKRKGRGTTRLKILMRREGRPRGRGWIGGVFLGQVGKEKSLQGNYQGCEKSLRGNRQCRGGRREERNRGTAKERDGSGVEKQIQGPGSPNLWLPGVVQSDRHMLTTDQEDGGKTVSYGEPYGTP